MDERTLRTVLLIQAIEQSDRTGEVLPKADRAEATRNAARDEPKLRDALARDALSPVTERFLGRRAHMLRERMEARSPVINHVLMLAGGAPWVGRLLALAAFVFGVCLSALDGSRRINILAFPLISLILWNLIVYVVLILDRLRSSTVSGRGSRLAEFYDRWLRWRADRMLRRSSLYNAPLAVSLRRFATEWGTVASRLTIVRAKRLFHVCAALVALGLMAGIYVRGIALRYEAGWESTFLGPSQVRMLLNTLYGPASKISGITLPASNEAIDALRWSATGGGSDAAMWIHLLALTALIFIVAPRLLAAGAATVSIWWSSRRVAPPTSLIPYVRETLAGVGETVHQVASVTPYAYEPELNALEGLDHLLTVALGGEVAVDVRDAVRYGEEETFQQRQTRTPSEVAHWHVLLMSLASTPEPENHGVVIASTRDALVRSRSGTPLVIVVDEGPYVSRLGADPSLRARYEDRRKLWKEFVAGYGLKACLMDLSRLRAVDDVSDRDREAVRDALWTARDRSAVS